MAKRANGEGTVARSANGTWEAKLTYADPATGQRRRVSFYGPTARAVRAKMKPARDRPEAGAPVRNATRTVGDWLAQTRDKGPRDKGPRDKGPRDKGPR